MNRALPPIAVLTTCLAIVASPAAARADEPAGPAAAPAPLPPGLPPAVPPPILPPEPPPTHVRSGWLIAGGSVTMAGGLVAAGFGGLALAFSGGGWGGNWGFQPSVGNPPPQSNTGVELGAGLITGGVLLFGGGITMIVFGAQRVPDVRATPAAMPTVAVGPRGGTLAWRF